jgi:hypothetical protein
MNDEISDNLDLRAVTDIFGDSSLQDFEDVWMIPNFKYQI